MHNKRSEDGLSEVESALGPEGIGHVEALKVRLKLGHKIFPSRFKIDGIFENEDGVVLKFTVHHEMKASIFGFPATNKVITYPAFFHLDFQDGKIITESWLMDMIHLLQEVGMSIIEEDDEKKIDEYFENLRKLKILPDKRVRR